MASAQVIDSRGFTLPALIPTQNSTLNTHRINRFTNMDSDLLVISSDPSSTYVNHQGPRYEAYLGPTPNCNQTCFAARHKRDLFTCSVFSMLPCSHRTIAFRFYNAERSAGFRYITTLNNDN